MQTYWNGHKWVTRLPDGTERDATNAEALLAYSNGAQAPVGTPGPALPAPAPPSMQPANPGDPPGGGVSHPGDDQGWTGPDGVTYYRSSDGIWRDAAGKQYAGMATPPAAQQPGMQPAPPPPAPPPPDMSWRANDQYSVYGRLHGQGSYYPGLDTSQQLFYQTGEGQHPAWQQFMAGEADPNSYYSRWLASQEGRVEGAFKNASVADPNLQRKDFYDQAAKGLYSTFANLPGWQQGYNAPGGYAGRRM